MTSIKTHFSALRLGLTGGIGSGKSTVAAMLARLGAAVVDADAISRSLTLAGGAAMPAIAQAFGQRFVAADGAMDRDAMRQLVFSDLGARARLEAIIHPWCLNTPSVKRPKPCRPVRLAWCLMCLCWWSLAAGDRAWMRCWWSIAAKPCKSAGSCSAAAGAKRRSRKCWPARPAEPNAWLLPMPASSTKASVWKNLPLR